MEKITSRKNSYIRHLRFLQSEKSYREECGEYVCDGEKMLREAVQYGAEITSVCWRGSDLGQMEELSAQYAVPDELFEYVSPLKNSPGPIFTVKMKKNGWSDCRSAVILEDVQDPGNVGTVIRTANAFCIDLVVLTGNSADLYSPKTVRASMGAIFRQAAVYVEDLAEFKKTIALPFYGAALSSDAKDLRNLGEKKYAVLIGSEGHGLSEKSLNLCDGQIIIPMNPDSESLNAAVAASVIMWEMKREDL